MKTYNVVGVKVIHAKDSQFFTEHNNGKGFVAIGEYGSEYFGDTKSQAFQRIVKSCGTDVIGKYHGEDEGEELSQNQMRDILDGRGKYESAEVVGQTI